MSSDNLTVPSAKGCDGLLGMLNQLRQARLGGVSFRKKYDPMVLDRELNPVTLLSYKTFPFDSLQHLDEDSLRTNEGTLGENENLEQLKPGHEQAAQETVESRHQTNLDQNLPAISQSSSQVLRDVGTRPKTSARFKRDGTLKPDNKNTDRVDRNNENIDIVQNNNTDQCDKVVDNKNTDKHYQTSDTTELEKKIIRQIEYYFGDFNLPRDRFMRDLIDEENGWISLSTMLTFPRLSAWSSDPFVIMSAIEKSSTQIVQVDRDYEDPESRIVGRIRRDPTKPVPKFDDSRRLEVQERTVFVTGFPRDNVSLDDLIDFFEGNFEQVVDVRMRKARRNEDAANEQSAPKFIGSVFVTFTSKKAADKFMHEHRSKLMFGTSELSCKLQKQFFNQKTEYSDSFRPEVLDQTVFVSGFDRMDTQEDQLVHFFGQFEGAKSAQMRLFRERKEDPWKFSGSVFVTFDDWHLAQKFLDLPVVTYCGDKLIRKWQLDFFQERAKFVEEIKKWRQEYIPDIQAA